MDEGHLVANRDRKKGCSMCNGPSSYRSRDKDQTCDQQVLDSRIHAEAFNLWEITVVYKGSENHEHSGDHGWKHGPFHMLAGMSVRTTYV